MLHLFVGEWTIRTFAVFHYLIWTSWGFRTQSCQLCTKYYSQTRVKSLFKEQRGACFLFFQLLSLRPFFVRYVVWQKKKEIKSYKTWGDKRRMRKRRQTRRKRRSSGEETRKDEKEAKRRSEINLQNVFVRNIFLFLFQEKKDLFIPNKKIK